MNDYPAGGGVDPIYLVSLVTLFAMLTAASYTELQSKRIPNWITVSGLLVGFVTGFLPGGLPLASSLMGFFVGFIFLFIFYMFGGMGGGDVKLMAAVGALQGYPMIMSTLLYTAFIGGIMAIWVLISHRNFWRGMYQSLAMLFRFKKPESEQTEEVEDKLGTIPYGIAIILGTFASVFLAIA